MYLALNSVSGCLARLNCLCFLEIFLTNGRRGTNRTLAFRPHRVFNTKARSPWYSPLFDRTQLPPCMNWFSKALNTLAIKSGNLASKYESPGRFLCVKAARNSAASGLLSKNVNKASFAFSSCHIIKDALFQVVYHIRILSWSIASNLRASQQSPWVCVVNRGD